MTIATRNPFKDQVAFASAATTGFSRSAGDATHTSLAVEACVQAIRAAGIDKHDINGLLGFDNPYIQSALGIPDIGYSLNPTYPLGFTVANAIGAIATGQCDVALAYHAVYRQPRQSRSAATDPFRSRQAFRNNPGITSNPVDGFGPDTMRLAVGYAGWAGRYLYEHSETRDLFGYVAVNGRTNAVPNSSAAMRAPLSFDDYSHARMIRWPLSMLDMDVPVDGADAFVITSTERARDMALKPVLIHAYASGMRAQNEEDQSADLSRHGQQIVVESLRAKSDIWLDDIDLFYPYDGFSNITIGWIENVGWCGPGEARGFLEQHWVADQNRLLINGRIPVNSHGGSLSEGGTQGSGHLREAIHQLQGRAGNRQVHGATKALLPMGGFFFNSQGSILRTD